MPIFLQRIRNRFLSSSRSKRRHGKPWGSSGCYLICTLGIYSPFYTIRLTLQNLWQGNRLTLRIPKQAFLCHGDGTDKEFVFKDELDTLQSMVNQVLASGSPVLGSLAPWPLSAIPSNCLLADGSTASRTTYPDLFALYGTQFGAGDGSTTFGLPDWRGVVPVGYKSGDDKFGTLGATVGEKSHTLTTSEMTNHTHGSGSGLPGGQLVSFVGSGSSAGLALTSGTNVGIACSRACVRGGFAPLPGCRQESGPDPPTTRRKHQRGERESPCFARLQKPWYVCTKSANVCRCKSFSERITWPSTCASGHCMPISGSFHKIPSSYSP